MIFWGTCLMSLVTTWLPRWWSWGWRVTVWCVPNIPTVNASQHCPSGCLLINQKTSSLTLPPDLISLLPHFLATPPPDSSDQYTHKKWVHMWTKPILWRENKSWYSDWYVIYLEQEISMMFPMDCSSVQTCWHQQFQSKKKKKEKKKISSQNSYCCFPQQTDSLLLY